MASYGVGLPVPGQKAVYKQNCQKVLGDVGELAEQLAGKLEAAHDDLNGLPLWGVGPSSALGRLKMISQKRDKLAEMLEEFDKRGCERRLFVDAAAPGIGLSEEEERADALAQAMGRRRKDSPFIDPHAGDGTGAVFAEPETLDDAGAGVGKGGHGGRRSSVVSHGDEGVAAQADPWATTSSSSAAAANGNGQAPVDPVEAWEVPGRREQNVRDLESWGEEAQPPTLAGDSASAGDPTTPRPSSVVTHEASSHRKQYADPNSPEGKLLYARRWIDTSVPSGGAQSRLTAAAMMRSVGMNSASIRRELIVSLGYAEAAATEEWLFPLMVVDPVMDAGLSATVRRLIKRTASPMMRRQRS